MELEVTSISEISQDQKGTYVFVRMWSLDFYMHTHIHAQIHPRKQRDTHCLIWEERPAKRVTREGDEQI